MDLSTQPLAQRLAVELRKLELSVRALNALHNAEIKFIGDLIQWNHQDLLGLQNCGRKTVEELCALAKSYGFDLGTKLTGWTLPEQSRDVRIESIQIGPEKPLLMAELDEETRAKLYLRIRELNLSPRARNALATKGVEFVGDLVHTTEAELRRLPNCGLKTVVELQARLDNLGFELGMKIDDWDPVQAGEARNTHDRVRDNAIRSVRLELTKAGKGRSLEGELRGILKAVASESHCKILLKFFGWNGEGARTLESVGQEYGVTRERIRQIAAKTSERLRNNEFETPWLDKAINIARSQCPATPTMLAEELKSREVAKVPFHPTGLQTACEQLGKGFGLNKIRVLRTELYVKAKDKRATIDFFRHCRRLTASCGCANFESVCDELGIEGANRENFRLVATVDGLCEWLDDDRRWLIAKGVSRNRIANIVAKVLHVCRTPYLAEVRRALYRSRGRLEVVPPLHVLARLIEYLGLGTVADNKVMAASDFPDAIERGSVEEMLVAVLRKHGPAISWERFRTFCTGAGINPITFGIYLSGSPVLARVSRGIYSLVGAEIPPGVVEEIEQELAITRKPVEWGWSVKGTFWCAVTLTGAILVAKSVRVPTAVAEIIEGEWRTLIGGHPVDGEIKCKNNFLWGFGRPLSNTGAEADDICIFEFDRLKHTVNLVLGDEELVDIWDRGDNELPPPELGESEEED